MKQGLNKALGLVLLVTGTLSGIQLRAQSSLDTYVKMGLDSNIVLRQKNIALDKSLLALKEAKSLFLPSLNANGSYSYGEGGRSIDFPIGDLLNPVYSTLNQMTGSSSFPQLENQEVQLFPKNYYDAHVRASLPLLNTDLLYNKRIHEDEIQLQQAELDIYKRELVKNIRQAYFNWLQSRDAVSIYASAEQLVQQNLSVNQSLLRNGKGLPANVLRAQSELDGVKAQKAGAENDQQTARSYFNFLINRPLESTIDTVGAAGLLAPQNLPAEISISKREELQQLQTGIHLQETVLQMNRNAWVPKIGAYVDLGTQGFNWKFDDKTRYYFTGLQVDFPIFNGNRNMLHIQQSRMDVQNLQLSLQSATLQLQLAASTARNNFSSAAETYRAAVKAEASAEAYFNLVSKGFTEGIQSQIELTDARNQLTSARLFTNICRYKMLSAEADFERQTATSNY